MMATTREVVESVLRTLDPLKNATPWAVTEPLRESVVTLALVLRDLDARVPARPAAAPALPEMPALDAARAIFRDLADLRIGEFTDATRKVAQRGGWYDPEDEKQPFFSEAYLYTLVGKDAARSILARFNALGAALGVRS
jgi:hypothetical protein